MRDFSLFDPSPNIVNISRQVSLIHIPPPRNGDWGILIWGGVYRIFSPWVRLCVQKLYPVHIFFLLRNIWSSYMYYTQTLLMTLTCVIKLTKGQKVARRKIAKLVTWSYLLMKKHCKFLFHKNIAFDLNMCHWLDPR